MKVHEKIVRHLKKGTSGRFAKAIFYSQCSDGYSSAWAKVSGKRLNLGDGEGMQVPCKLSLSGQPKSVSLLRKELIKTRNATRCKNCDDLLHLNFTLKVSIFSGAYI